MGARSKGCIVCKSRRVKCDETRPSCRRCFRAGMKCKGYESALKFIDENARIKHTQVVAQTQEREYRIQYKHRQLYHSSHLSHLAAEPPAEIPLVGFQEEMTIAFLMDKLHQGRSHCNKLPLGSRNGPPLILIAPRTRVKWIGAFAKVPHAPLSALASQWFGPAHGLHGMTVDSLQLYGQALIDLRKNLLRSESVMDFSVLASLTSFCMFELTTYSTETGWMKHAEALERLMEARGPAKQKYDPEKSMFLEQRIIIVSKALIEQKRTILGHPDWKRIPWEDDILPKPSFESLIDIMCDIPGHLEDMKTINKEQRKVTPEELAGRVALSLAELDEWWHGWIIEDPQACYEIESTIDSTVIIDEDGPLFPTVLRYTSLSAAYLACTYDCGRIILLYLQRCLDMFVGDQLDIVSDRVNETYLSANDNEGPLLGLCYDPTKLAHEILRSFDYCCEQAGGFMASFCVMVIENIEYGALKPDSREAKWLKGRSMH